MSKTISARTMCIVTTEECYGSELQRLIRQLFPDYESSSERFKQVMATVENWSVLIDQTANPKDPRFCLKDNSRFLKNEKEIEEAKKEIEQFENSAEFLIKYPCIYC